MPETNGKTAEARPRKFVFNGMQLADPDPGITPQKVAEFHSLLHAEALVNRCNLGFALNWKAHPERYRFTRSFDILIACADSRKSRKEIFQTLPKKNGPYVLDGGVLATCGQVIIGNGSRELPYPYAELPTLIDTKVEEQNLPSCSLAESLSVQELFVNQWLATAELELIWRLFRKGGLDYRGFYINLDTGRMNPVPIGE